MAQLLLDQEYRCFRIDELEALESNDLTYMVSFRQCNIDIFESSILTVIVDSPTRFTVGETYRLFLSTLDGKSDEV